MILINVLINNVDTFLTIPKLNSSPVYTAMSDINMQTVRYNGIILCSFNYSACRDTTEYTMTRQHQRSVAYWLEGANTYIQNTNNRVCHNSLITGDCGATVAAHLYKSCVTFLTLSYGKTRKVSMFTLRNLVMAPYNQYVRLDQIYDSAS
jgi:hypothetical protein